MRNVFGLLPVLLGGAAIVACSTEPMAPATASNAKQWVGGWVLKLDHVGLRQTTLWIKEANGNITATLRREPDTPVEIDDISVGSRALVLKYTAPTQSSKTTKAALMLRIGSDRTVEIHDPSTRTIQRGVAGRVSVSQEFIESLQDEPDNELMIKRAQAAGLIVEAMALNSGGKLVRIVDPATGIIVLTSSTMP